VVLAAPDQLVSAEKVWTMPADEPMIAPAIMWNETRRFDREQIAAMRSEFAARVLSAGIQSMLSVPLKTSKRVLGTLNVGSIQASAFSDLEEGLIQQVASQIAVALDNARAYREIEELRDRLAKEKSYLEDEIQTELHFEEIIGDSPLLKRVLSQVRTVAPSGA